MYVYFLAVWREIERERETEMEEDELDDSEVEEETGQGMKRTFSFQTAHLNTLFKSGMTSAAKRHRPILEKAAADTGLTVQQVVVSH